MVAASSQPVDAERNDEATPLLRDKAVKSQYSAVPDPEAFFRGLPPKEKEDFLIGWPPTRNPFLDVTRICCVWCVAVDHGNSTFGIWNCMFSQAWVLQYLFLVCGVCYGMSKKSWWAYEGRLFILFVVGILINIFGFWYAGKEDTSLFSMIFQFWFVAGLMLYSLLLAPLRYLGPRLRSTSVLSLTAWQPGEQGGARSLLTAHQPTEAVDHQPEEIREHVWQDTPKELPKELCLKVDCDLACTRPHDEQWVRTPVPDALQAPVTGWAQRVRQGALRVWRKVACAGCQQGSAAAALRCEGGGGGVQVRCALQVHSVKELRPLRRCGESVEAEVVLRSGLRYTGWLPLAATGGGADPGTEARQLTPTEAPPDSAGGSAEDTDSLPLWQPPPPVMQAAPGPFFWQRALLIRVLIILVGGLFMLGLLFKVFLVPAMMELSKSIWKVTAFFGGGMSWGWPTNELEARYFLEDQCTYLLATCCSIYLFLACPLIFERKSLTTWFIFINMYMQRCAFYRSGDERMFHGLDLMLLALSCFYMGITHRRVLGEYAIRYWFLVIFVCSILWPPGTHRRFDEEPPAPGDGATRVRVQLIEGIVVLYWLVAGDRMFQKEIFTEDGLDFLNWWALLVFLVHKAVHVAVPPPLNWAVLVALAPAVYVVLRLLPRRIRGCW